MDNKVHISPSILSADFGRLNEDIASIEVFSDSLHVDVMDRHFVPNLTFGAPVVRCIKTTLPLECHLMVEHPENYVDDFKKAGAHMFIFHVETTKDPLGLIAQVKAAGMKAGVSLNPETPVSMVEGLIQDVDSVLVMSVHPGFGGQSFIPDALEKIRRLRSLSGDLEIAVDGGINAETGRQCVEAGANVLIAGSYVFGSSDRKTAINSLRS
jgi:ribulose-phosphate 3-epimerase